MQLQMEMTERDKKLLYRLGLVVIGAVFVLGSFRPLYRALTEKNESIAAAEETKRVLDNKIVLLPGLEESHAQSQAAIDELMALYYEPMNSAQIDKMLTDYMLSKGLLIRDMNIQTSDSTVVFEPYVNSKAGKELSGASSVSADQAASGSGESGSTQVSDTSASGIYAVNVSMKVTGSDASVTAMLDDFDSLRPKARLVSCRWSGSGSTGDINDEGILEFKESDEVQLEMSVQLFMTGLPQ